MMTYVNVHQDPETGVWSVGWQTPHMQLPTFRSFSNRLSASEFALELLFGVGGWTVTRRNAS